MDIDTSGNCDTPAIIYRDERMLAVCKPSGMLVHRGWARDGKTLADFVRDDIIHAPVHAVHRLDRPTSGIVLFALDPEFAKVLHESLKRESSVKEYIALVRGPMKEATTLDYPVPKRSGEGKVDAITAFEPIEHVDRWTLVRALPKTGRLHQIRKHLRHLSHPIVGDVQYGKGDINRFFRSEHNLHRLALHLLSVSLDLDGEIMNLQAPIPDDLQKPLNSLGMTSIETMSDSVS